MTIPHFKHALPAALLTFLALATAQPDPVSAQTRPGVSNVNNDPDFYVGLWVTADGYVRHELLSGGRYDEARGDKQSAYRGTYRLSGDRIDYRDDTGFTADGEFRGGVLHHGGMVLRRKEKEQPGSY
jgi:Agrobacterium tumefaciens protein Atu4866